MKTATVRYKSLLKDGYRFDPDIHLSEGVVIRRTLESLPFPLSTVGDNSDRVFLGNIISRVFVKDNTHGLPYLAASDTVLSNIDTGRFLSNKQASELSNLILKKDWILITCSGTLGNVTYTNQSFENHIATHDLIRVVPNDGKVRKGTLYAFLSSKYGYYQITQSMFGGVVKHINDSHARGIVVPIFPDDVQNEIEQLISSAAEAREKASLLLKEAHRLVEEFINYSPSESKSGYGVKASSLINSYTHRFEGAYYVSENRSLFEYIKKTFDYKPLKEHTDKIFRPGIFKRQYVKNGVPFLGGADIMLATPTSEKQLSFKQVESMPELLVHKGWILITCGGTIGNAVYVDDQLSDCAISQHVLRVKPQNIEDAGYLYAFLSSSIGYKLITMYTYGSVIPQVEPHHIERIPVPSFPVELQKRLNGLINEYSDNLSFAKESEKRAKAIIEETIEKYTKQ